MPMLPEPKDKVPERLHIVNAGSYRVDLPPILEFSDAVLDKLQGKDQGKPADGKDAKAGTPLFMRSGTIVNTPPR